MRKILILALALMLCVVFVACKKEEAPPEASGPVFTKGLEFKLLENDTYEVSGIGTATGDFLVIPDTYEDKAVTSIGIQAFKNARFLSVTIPASITNIEAGAFENCASIIEIYNLSELEMSTGALKHGGIAQHAKIIHTSADKPSVVATSGEYSFAKLNEREIYLLKYTGTKAKDVVLPDGYEGRSYHISPYAFAGHDEIVTLTLSNAVLSIGYGSFEGCTALTKVTTGKFLTAIADGDGTEEGLKSAFASCPRLVEIYNLSALELVAGATDNGLIAKNAKVVHASLDEPSIIETINNIVFASFGEDAILLSYLGKDTNLTLPATYKGNAYSIAERAFSGSESLVNVTLPAGVKSISRGAFANCTSLRSINIPLSVEMMGSEVFGGCTSLKTILCQAPSKPSAWNSSWSFSCDAEVVWNCK